MKIYLAHNLSAKEMLRGVRDTIEAMGHEVTSRWLDIPNSVLDSTRSRAELMEGAMMDIDDIDRSDAILHFTDQYGPTPGRGKYIELGYALGKGKVCFVYGEFESCVFYFMPGVIWLTDIRELTEFPGKLALDMTKGVVVRKQKRNA